MELIISIFRGLLGIACMLGLCYALSKNRKAIDWKLVGGGLGLQLLLAILILQVPFVYGGFQWIADRFVDLLNFTEAGATFLFGAWPAEAWVEQMDFSNGQRIPFKLGYMFAFKVLPTVVFFSAFSAILFYLGILQKIIYGFAWLMSRFMRLTGAESTAAAANVFIGQTEAPLVVKPYLENMSKSEIMCLMTGGMATIAGGVFALFVALLGPNFAIHFLTASIISAPAAIVAAKILYPEPNPKAITTNINVPKEKLGNNLLDAISIGTTDGVRLAVNVGAMLLVFIALIALLNGILLGVGELIQLKMMVSGFSESQRIAYLSIIGNEMTISELLNILPEGERAMYALMAENETTATAFFEALSTDQKTLILEDQIDLNRVIEFNTGGRFQGLNLEYILGLIFAPIAWLLGVPSNDIMIIGQLLGKKTVINEVVAYADLSVLQGKDSNVVLDSKSVIIATYALCGFSNFSSIGIQIGGISAIAPGQRKTLTEFGLLALVGGTVACFITAAIAGMLH